MGYSAENAERAYADLLRALDLNAHLSDASATANLSSELLYQLTRSVHESEPQLGLIEAPEGSDWVVLDEIPFYSLCEHHFVPFFGTARIAYRPDRYIAGLGGFIRLLDHFSRQPQLQERLTQQLGMALKTQLMPKEIDITLKARQMCVELRGQPSIVVETHFKA